MPPSIYQIKVFLKDIEPHIWRRFQVRSDITLRKLHSVLQEIMGWNNSHLYMFKIDGVEYAMPDPDGELDFKDDSKVRLDKVLPKTLERFEYQYDFGDSWEHVLIVEEILPAEAHSPGALCMEGERACPPEDVGSTEGYAEFLKAIKNPKHREHKDMLTWAGGAFDSEAFDLNRINRNLQKIVRMKPGKTKP